jgi:ubiquitin carboxyl-terminal hydrolase 9/13
VTIIRTSTTWLVFDDETVEPIKETEITKYFGESNSGSAYVLYYQAVDLDLAALGLRPVVSAPLSDPAEVSTRPSFEPPASPPITVPSHPPGLTDDLDSSDVSEHAPPVTPPQPSPVIPFVDRALHKSVSSQPQQLTVNASSPDDDISNPPGVVPGSLTSPGTGTKAGLFQSLRHSPSMKIRGHSFSSTGLEKRKSLREKITRPSTSNGVPKPDDPPEPLPPVPALPTWAQAPILDDREIGLEKVKAPERKASVWFKRKSGRADKRPGTSTGTPTSPDPGGDVNPPSSSPSPAALFRNTTTQMEDIPKTHHPSEAPLNGVGPFRGPVSASTNGSHSPKHSADLSLALQHRVKDRRGGYDTPSPSSATSSIGSGSAQPSDIPNNTAILPTIPASPQGHSVRQSSNSHSTMMSSSPRSPIDHKRSQHHLKVEKFKELSSTISLKLPPRPSTAGASTGRQTIPSVPEPPLPPLPPFPKVVPTHRRRASNGEASDTIHRTHSGGRPNSAHVGTNLNADPTFRRDATTMASSTHATAPLKRPSRKLSLSSPLLGFGKKDKNKDKEKTPSYEKVAEVNAKDREKEAKAQDKARPKDAAKKREQNEKHFAPSAFSSFARV